MEAIIKTILCSGILIGWYHIFLAKEKIFTFNRFYLLFSLAFSFIIPFISFDFTFINESSNLQAFRTELTEIQLTPTTSSDSFDWTKALWFIYGIGVFFLLSRFVFALLKINTIKGETFIKNHIKVIVSDDIKSPFSFWQTMYLNPSHCTEKEPQKSIFMHESNHIKGLHAIDIFLVEILRIVFWFNPFLYWYKKAIQNNHEFLADEEVLNHNVNIKTYQHLILNEISTAQHHRFTHTFNYHNTKKRFIMMTTPKSKFSTLKKGIAIGAFALLTFSFTPTTLSQNGVQSTTKSSISKITPPVFPGGEDKFRELIATEFNPEIIEGLKETQTTIAFYTIDKNGKFQKIETKGKNKAMNKEIERCFLKISDGILWTPAKKDGKAVDYTEKLSISMAPPKGINPPPPPKAIKPIKSFSSDEKLLPPPPPRANQ